MTTTTTAGAETWIEVEDPQLAQDDVPVSKDVGTRRLLVLQLLVFLVSALVGLALSTFDLEGGPDKVLITGSKLASAAVALSIVDRLGWYRRVGLGPPRRWNRLWLAWLPALYAVATLAGGTSDRAVLSVLGVAGVALAIGFEEELWTRGLVLESLRWKGTTVAVVLSALWFGLLHSLNLLSGQPATATLAQVGFATAYGLAVGAVRVRVGTLGCRSPCTPSTTSGSCCEATRWWGCHGGSWSASSSSSPCRSPSSAWSWPGPRRCRDRTGACVAGGCGSSRGGGPSRRRPGGRRPPTCWAGGRLRLPTSSTSGTAAEPTLDVVVGVRCRRGRRPTPRPGGGPSSSAGSRRPPRTGPPRPPAPGRGRPSGR